MFNENNYIKNGFEEESYKNVQKILEHSGSEIGVLTSEDMQSLIAMHPYLNFNSLDNYHKLPYNRTNRIERITSTEDSLRWGKYIDTADFKSYNVFGRWSKLEVFYLRMVDNNVKMIIKHCYNICQVPLSVKEIEEN